MVIELYHLEETDSLVHNVLLILRTERGGTPGSSLAGLSQRHHGNVPDGFPLGLQGGVEGGHGEGSYLDADNSRELMTNYCGC